MHGGGGRGGVGRGGGVGEGGRGATGGDPSSERMRRAKSATCGLEKEGHASPASSRVERRGGLTANWEEGPAGSRRT